MSTDVSSRSTRPSPPATRSRAVLLWLAVVIAVLGVVGGTALGLSSYRDSQRHLDTFDRVAIPGAMTVEVPEPADRVVYVEGADDVTYDDLAITVRDPLGDPVAVEPYEGELVYETLDLITGRAVATFHADRSGDYRVEVSGDASGDLTVGDSFAREALPGVLGSIGIVLVSLAAALTLAFVALIRGTRRPPAEEGVSMSTTDGRDREEGGHHDA